VKSRVKNLAKSLSAEAIRADSVFAHERRRMNIKEEISGGFTQFHDQAA
jgi:hypothetical protein